MDDRRREGHARRYWSREEWCCEGAVAGSDVLLAAQQLMHLSDEDNGNDDFGISFCDYKKKKKQKGGGTVGAEEGRNIGAVFISASAKGLLVAEEEAFGTEEGIHTHWLKKRKRRYRDIADIYEATAANHVKYHIMDDSNMRQA
ncbi:hypothetical protein SAY87_005839 [Trapa incisa]|uniref:Uncharacterized protein n=1 Tax=Trapa incisa TaxID=236973 RepID=A0AAN7K6J4_9MYRT|nr:hypothetical protein SAY87_005839 [Trapa incisa]